MNNAANKPGQLDRPGQPDKHVGVFNFIAPVYGLFYGFQKKLYCRALDKAQGELDLSVYKSVVDVGCGTGAFCSVLKKRGFAATGVDPSEKMLGIARRRTRDEGIDFTLGSATERLPFADKSFDISVASYVAHGLKAGEREKMFSEMSRVTGHLVIIHDYNGKGSFLTGLVERLEGGDYFNFVENIRNELEESFYDYRIIKVFNHAAWYVCTPKA